MDWLYALGALVLIALTAPFWPMLGRSLKRGRRGGGLGPALGELNAAFDPSRRHVERVAEERAVERKAGDPPTDEEEPEG
jgi:hypothetical protein